MLDVPLFKIVQRPLLPVSGSWIDAAPFIIFLVLLTSVPLAMRVQRHRQLLRRAYQALSSFLFIVFLHRCLCILRGWVFALKTVGRNDVIAFGYLCMFAMLVAVTLTIGRVFCGWACPLGFFQEILSWPARRRAHLPRKQRLLSGYLTLGGLALITVWMAYLVRPGTQFFSENVAALWGAAVLTILFVVLPHERHDRPFKRIRMVSLALWLFLSVLGVFVTSPWCTLFGDEVDYSSIVALFSVLAGGLVLSMPWCRYVCPMGAALGLLAKHAPIRMRNTTPCTQCGTCEKLCPMGAIENGKVDHTSCIYCCSCVGTCGFNWHDHDLREAPTDAAPSPEGRP